MGFFSSSKPEPPPTPLPSLELRLGHSQDTVIKPGDVVQGHILFSTPIIITPQAIEVTFSGVSRTWIRKESSSTNSSTNSTSTDYYHYRDLAPLFTVTQNVLSKTNGDDYVPGKLYQIPFAFTMPTSTAYNRTTCYQHSEDGIFTVSPHDLPPTLLHGRNGPEVPNNCSISYGLTARLICPEFPVDQISCAYNTPILFTPHNSYAHIQTPNRVRLSKPFKLSSSVLSGQTPSNIGFRQSVRDKLSSQTPRIDFELAVEVPDILTSGSEFHFRSTFTALKKTENVTKIPEIQFRVLKLELLDFTFFRAPRDWKANRFRSGEHTRDGTLGTYRAKDEMVCDENKTLLNSVPDVRSVEVPVVRVEQGVEQGVEQESACEAWFSGRIPGLVPPSFKSFAVTRAYRVKVKIGIEIGGKNFDFTVEGPEVHIGSA